jgi:hypothetical protein
MTKIKRMDLGITFEIIRTYCLCLADGHVQERVQSKWEELNARKRDCNWFGKKKTEIFRKLLW